MVRTFLILAMVCLSASAAVGATLKVLHGEALVRRGAGTTSVNSVSELAVGDTVLAKPGSSAEVLFPNGCTVFLGMGMVFDVPTEPPCGGAGESGTAGGSSDTTGALGTQDWTSATQTVASENTQNSFMPYLLGAAAVGGVAAGAIALSGGDREPPASP
ncbi:MAG: hypothetical protein JSR99_17380 [Proteobacteria bacterium]|nr:hypothetical protein [Pseudomonadota bacterium]